MKAPHEHTNIKYFYRVIQVYLAEMETQEKEEALDLLVWVEQRETLVYLVELLKMELKVNLEEQSLVVPVMMVLLAKTAFLVSLE